MIEAVFSESRRRLEAAQPKSVEEVRNHGSALIAFPPEADEAEEMINDPAKLDAVTAVAVNNMRGMDAGLSRAHICWTASPWARNYSPPPTRRTHSSPRQSFEPA